MASAELEKLIAATRAARYRPGATVAELREPLASPLHGNLSGLPPMLVQVGSIETMLDDSTAFAERA